MAKFVDKVKLFISAGNGGHGCMSIRREKYKPLAGPDGGNGGNGGSIIFKTNPNVTTLVDLQRNPHIKAQNGVGGMGGYKDGAKAEDKIIQVPIGTVVKNSFTGEQLVDLVEVNEEFIVAKGGNGGLGNSHLISQKLKAPQFALLGEPGEEIEVSLELKTVADVALVGFPSAGKSSLISGISNAKPKIAEYPFTTLIPHLGIVSIGEYRYCVADVPGLIPGASQGKGLGLEFLRHIERCSIIAHVIDCGNLDTKREPLSDYMQIENELNQYAKTAKKLKKLPRVVVLAKIDLPDALVVANMAESEFKKLNLPVYKISAATKLNLDPLLYEFGALVEKRKKKLAKKTKKIQIVEPVATNSFYSKNGDAIDYEIIKKSIIGQDRQEEFLFRVIGEKCAKWVYQTDFENEYAIAYFNERLQKIKLDESLIKHGIKPGNTVSIAKNAQSQDIYEFEWQPNE